MKLARAAAMTQLALLDLAPSLAIRNVAHARTVYGELAQVIACRALGLTPISIDGRCETCFDAERRDAAAAEAARFFEIKSVHRRGKLVLYQWRMEKEARFPGLVYVLVVHQARCCQNMVELVAAYTRGLELWLVPSPVIHAAANLAPLRQHAAATVAHAAPCARNGHLRAGYVDGFKNVPLAGLRPNGNGTECPVAIWNFQFNATVREAGAAAADAVAGWKASC